MKRILGLFIICVIATVLSCKKKQVDPEPVYILQKWARSTENLNYKEYSGCEAYPKSEPVFREMFKDDYYKDIMTLEIGYPQKEKVEKDYKGNSFISRNVVFEGAVVKRRNKEPYQIVRGDVVFIKFSDGEKSKDGWLLSNRTITRINR